MGRRIQLKLEDVLALPRPETYVHELAACALEIRGRVVVDADSACYRELEQAYADHRPSDAERSRAEALARKLEASKGNRRRQTEKDAEDARRGKKRTRSGCGGCRGRKVRR